jgi:hypothetical protein
MSYSKFMPLNPNSDTSFDAVYMLSAIRNAILGSDWTGLSYANAGFNPATGTYAGTAPTAGIYSVSSPYNSGSSSRMTITKKHYATGQTSGYTPTTQIFIKIDLSYGWRIRVYDNNGVNGMPSSTDNSHWMGGTGASYDKIGSNYAQDFHEVHLIANDTTLALKVVSTGTDTTRDHGWFVISDLEYAPAIDNWAYGVDDTYCPSASVFAVNMNVMDNPVPSESNANYAHFGVGMNRYIDQSGTMRNADFSYATAANALYHWQHITANRKESTVIPSPAVRVKSFPIAGGDGPAHQIIPMQFVGQNLMQIQSQSANATGANGNPRHGRMMNFYRTTDNLGVDGDVITEGSTRYRIMKAHKGGHTHHHEADFNACYAFPEDNVPY